MHFPAKGCSLQQCTVARAALCFGARCLLLAVRGGAAVQAILAAPMGVVRLMDLVSDAREAIRNEALLLLVGLTRSSPDIQKIAAFEGAFDRLLSTIL